MIGLLEWEIRAERGAASQQDTFVVGFPSDLALKHRIYGVPLTAGRSGSRSSTLCSKKPVDDEEAGQRARRPIALGVLNESPPGCTPVELALMPKSAWDWTVSLHNR